MANEIQPTFSLSVTNGTFKDAVASETLLISQALAGKWDTVISIPTSDTALSPANITTMGWLYLKNLDATNFLSYGPTSGGAIVKLGRIKPGEHAWLRLEPGITLRMQADTAAVKVQVKLYND
jgi:hypothetical protein